MIARTFLSAAAIGLSVSASEAQVSLASPHVHVFSDTTSVRVEFTIPSPTSLNGATVTGKIVSAADSSLFWSGNIGTFAVGSDGLGRVTGKVVGLNPKRWSPQSPSLYFLTVTAGTGASRIDERVRFGFRSMAMKNGKLLLNGRPIFLRGNAINPPDRNIPDSLEENRGFVEDYVRYLKSINVNIIRLTRHSQMWFDVCDELGMMLFQGNYGTPQGGKATEAPTRPLTESVNWYRNDVIGPLANHPSVVIYVLSNEQADAEIGYLKEGAEGVNRFLTAMYDSLHAWDDTRLYIANAGYGFGRAGDICDLHRYWGWYYNSFLSFYTMRDPKVCWRRDLAQPMTMTENVGNYTGVDGRFNLVPATKQPASQLNWTGHAPQSEQSERALNYQAWMAKQAIEIYRRTREENPSLAGLTPFTILFRNWWGISRFGDMKPKPIGAQYGISYQPVLLSWELWSPNAYAGSTIRPVAHVVNDSDNGRDLSNIVLHYSLIGPNGHASVTGQTPLAPVPYYSATSKTLPIVLPANLQIGIYKLAGQITRGIEVISRNETTVWVAPRSFGRASRATSRQVLLYDAPSGRTARAFRELGIDATPVKTVATVNPGEVLVIGAEAWNEALSEQTSQLRKFIAQGGRLIILHQDTATFNGSWLPSPVHLQRGELDHSLVFPGGRPFRNGMAVNPEKPAHPVFDGLNRDRLFLWSDFTGWNETKAGFPQVYPVTSGFVITDKKSLGHASILADYDHGLEGIALVELFEGSGSVLLTGFNLVDRAGMDPVSDRMLVNMIRYMASGPKDRADSAHHAAPLITSRIVWGDYESERGLLTGIYSGLLLNAVPVVPSGLETKYPITVDAEGNTFAGGSSGWNTKPAIQYVPKGRRVFGPYTFSSGGSVELIDKNNKIGEGRFWVRVPSTRQSMLTTISNPLAQPLDIEIGINGSYTKSSIPAGSTTTVRTTIQTQKDETEVSFKADRRLVLLETDFK